MLITPKPAINQCGHLLEAGYSASSAAWSQLRIRCCIWLHRGTALPVSRSKWYLASLLCTPPMWASVQFRCTSQCAFFFLHSEGFTLLSREASLQIQSLLFRTQLLELHSFPFFPIHKCSDFNIIKARTIMILRR